MNTILIVLAAVVITAAVTWAITHFAQKAKLIALESELREQKSLLKLEQANAEVRNSKMSDAFKKEAKETLESLTGALNKDIREMKDAFDAQKKASAEESSSIKTKFDETVKNLRIQTESIGNQAADLASALKGKNKMQGIFGETVLENLLKAEGLTKGRDYDSEFWLRDKKGGIIHNEDTGKRMRPDFALHFPDNTDILIDAKMSLTALSDYFSADSEDERKDAARRNLQSVMDHIGELNEKEYQKFIHSRKTLDYVIMFIPNWQIFVKYIIFVFILVLIHNAAAFGIGYAGAAAMKLPRKDRRSITIEVGIQNSGLGLTLLLNPAIFKPEIWNNPEAGIVYGGMLFVTAWWGIWHIVSGLTLASIFKKHPVPEE